MALWGSSVRTRSAPPSKTKSLHPCLQAFLLGYRVFRIYRTPSFRFAQGNTVGRFDLYLRIAALGKQIRIYFNNPTFRKYP